MALNTAHALNGAGVVLYNGERILLYTQDVRVAVSENTVSAFKGEKKGKVYLTTHRVIFINNNQNDGMQSFSIPFQYMREVELEQPVFGANHIKGKVLAEPNGRWVGSAKFKLWFFNGGAIEFGQAMMRAGQMALGNRGSAPPPYAPRGNVFPAPPPAYSLIQDPNYGWLPYATFPSAPPASDVYMTDAPPPYPGVIPSASLYTPPTQSMPGAYYDPNNPGTAYAPMPTAPPEYQATTIEEKKRV